MSDFPSKQNPQPCKNGCGTKIYLSDKKQKGKWLPYELTDVVHECPKKPTNGTISSSSSSAASSITKQEKRSFREPSLNLDKDISELLEQVNEDYVKDRITSAEHYQIQTNIMIWKQLLIITNLLENKK